MAKFARVVAVIMCVVALIMRVAANIARVTTESGQKFPCQKAVLIFFGFFLGFSMVKIHFFQKVLKKWSSFRKKLLYFFPLLGAHRV